MLDLRFDVTVRVNSQQRNENSRQRDEVPRALLTEGKLYAEWQKVRNRYREGEETPQIVEGPMGQGFIRNLH